MVETSNIWTPALDREFHRRVLELSKLTETPAAAQYCRDRAVPESTDHVLSFRDELQIADDIAFLSHSEEGAHHVSAVTLQEHPGCLIVLLASNSTPSKATIQGLGEIVTIIRQYAVQSKHPTKGWIVQC